MKEEEILKKFRNFSCETGTIFTISWDRGNGLLKEDFVYFESKDNDVPILKRYEKGKSLNEYVENAHFDILNPALKITDISIFPHKSEEYSL